MQLVFQDIAAISVEYLSALATAGGGMLHLNGLAEDPNLLGDFFQDVSNRLQEVSRRLNELLTACQQIYNITGVAAFFWVMEPESTAVPTSILKSSLGLA